MAELPLSSSQPDVVRWWARLDPGRLALVDRRFGLRLTYGDIDVLADGWARLLRDKDIGPGDRVAILSGNRHDQVALFGACLRLGAIVVPLNWRLSDTEVARIIADCSPAVMVGEGRFRALAEAAARQADAGLEWIDFDDEAPALLARARTSEPVPIVRAESSAPTMLLYTSGSTGRPKGVVLPHRQLQHNAIATTVGWQLGASDVAAVTTPFFHTGGWHVFAMPMLHVGGAMVLFEQFEPSTFLDALAEEGVTVAFGVPTQIVMLQDQPSWGRPLPSLRWLISGGAPCPRTVADRVRAAGIAFREGFGMTECGPNCFATTDQAALEKPGSVGWPIPYLEMRLDAADGREADVDEPGELLLRGPQMFDGYWRDPVRTAEALTTDGWLRTGDLARRDADGAFTICGRRKEMYISGGENVFPGEVEAVLAECPGVREAVVVGIADARWGEVGRAFVVARAGETVTAEQVVAHARARLAGYKVPRSVVILDDLPRLGSGKADRSGLASWPAATVGA